jgi:acetyltransferase-like isoleucine patch superfamily enzyme
MIDRFVDVTAKYGSLMIGSGTYVGQFSVICARQAITIGADCLIAEHVTIRDQDHDFGGARPTSRNGFVTEPIRIGNNVWLGAKVTVLKGVTIGDNVVVGANSVVTRDLPNNVVAAGAPARVLRQLRCDGVK